MKKRITASILALLLLVMTLPTTVFAASGVQFTVTPSSASATAGDEIEFTVKVTSDVTTLGFIFEYDIPAGAGFGVRRGTATTTLIIPSPLAD